MTLVRSLAALLILFPSLANAQLFERTIRRAEGRYVSLLSGIPFDSGALVAWNELAAEPPSQSFIQFIDERGEKRGWPLRVGTHSSSAALAGDTHATLLVWNEGLGDVTSLLGAWIQPGPEIGAPFELATGPVRTVAAAAQDGTFAVAWTTPDSVHVGVLSPGGTNFAKRSEVARGNPSSYKPVHVALAAERMFVAWEEPRSTGAYSSSFVARAQLLDLGLNHIGDLIDFGFSEIRSVLALQNERFAVILQRMYDPGESVQHVSLSGAVVSSVPLLIEQRSTATYWQGQIAMTWRRYAGSLGPPYLSIASSNLNTVSVPARGFRISSSEQVREHLAVALGRYVVGAFVAVDEKYEHSVGYTVIDPLDGSGLPPVPPVPSLLRQDAQHEHVSIVADLGPTPAASRTSVHAVPLDDPRILPKLFPVAADPAVFDGLSGDTLYSLRTFHENDRGFVASNALAFRAVPSATPRPPLWLTTVANADGTWTVRWLDMSSNETSYRILIRMPHDMVTLVTLPPNTTEATFAPPEPTRGYIIAVVAGSQAMWTGIEKPVPAKEPSRRRTVRRQP